MDLRIEHIFTEAMQGDTSFQEKESGLSLLFGTHKYSKQEMREIKNSGKIFGKFGPPLLFNIPSSDISPSYLTSSILFNILLSNMTPSSDDTPNM